MLNKDDLFRALDLDSRVDATAESIQVESQDALAKKEPSLDNALNLDRWTKRQGQQIYDQLHDPERPDRAEVEVRSISQLKSIDLADLHSSVFNPTPELIAQEDCRDALKHRYFTELLDTPGFHELRQSTVLDDMASDLAIEHLSHGLVKLRAEQKDRSNEPGDGFEIARAASSAVSQAKSDVKDMQDARDGLGFGPGSGSTYDIKSATELYKRLRKSPILKRIMNLAGKYRAFAQSQQRRKVAHGYDDVVGVTLGNEIPRLTQTEFMSLIIPELELDTYRRILENQAMVRDHADSETVAKGPMILAIDESGSMNAPDNKGIQNIWKAKAIALTFAYLAKQQNRWAALVSFSGANERRTVVLSPGKWDQIKLLEWLEGFFAGGTVPPVADMPAIYESTHAPIGKTDLVYITDGQVSIDPEEIHQFNTWKKSVNAKVITLVVAAHPGDMTRISDQVNIVKDLDLNDGVGVVLSI